MIFRPERDANVRSLHFFSSLNALSQVDLGVQATSEDHIDLPHLILVIGIGLTMFASTGFLSHWHWWWHLLTIQKRFVLFQIMLVATDGSHDICDLCDLHGPHDRLC
jgi:hypothetical protein